MEQSKSIKEILDTYGKYTGLTMGTSMKPLIHEQRDNIIVVKNKGRLKKYDVPVYVTKQGKYIMHRIVEEYVTDDMICGVLVGFYKDGKKYIDCQNSKAYKIYSKIWVALLPVRPFILLFPRGINWIKRHIFKKR